METANVAHLPHTTPSEHHSYLSPPTKKQQKQVTEVTFCGIAWSVDAETNACSTNSWPTSLSHLTRLCLWPNQMRQANAVTRISPAAQCITSTPIGGAVHSHPSLPNLSRLINLQLLNPTIGVVHSSTCKFKTSTCHYCKKLGHLASVCRKNACDQKSASRGGRESQNHQLEAADSGKPNDDTAYTLYYSATK